MGGAMGGPGPTSDWIELAPAADRLARIAVELRSIYLTLSCGHKWGEIDESHWEDGIAACLTNATGEVIDALAGVFWAIEHPPTKATAPTSGGPQPKETQ